MMQLLVFILKKVELKESIIKQLAIAGVKGGTILDGTGIAKELVNMEDLPFVGLLRQLMTGEEADNKVMLFVLKDEQLEKAVEIIKKVIGDLNKPNTGIMFSIPINNVEGLGE